MKEVLDLRPIRQWNIAVVIRYLLIAFLTNCLVKLTHFLSKNSVVKNLKLLKKIPKQFDSCNILCKKWVEK